MIKTPQKLYMMISRLSRGRHESISPVVLTHKHQVELTDRHFNRTYQDGVCDWRAVPFSNDEERQS